MAGDVLGERMHPRSPARWHSNVTGCGVLAAQLVRSSQFRLAVRQCCSSVGVESVGEGLFDGSFATSARMRRVATSKPQIADVPAGFLCPALGVAQGQDNEVQGSWINLPPGGSGPLALMRP